MDKMGKKDWLTRYIMSALFSLLILGSALCVWAQDGAYRLHKDDIIVIRLYGDEAMTTRTPVGKDGNVTFPLIGSVKADGLSVEELARLIEVKLIDGQYYVSPKVSIVIEAFYKPRVTILGMVNRSGVYDFTPEMRVLDAISIAGNILPDRADLRKSTITRKDSPTEPIPLDLHAMMNKGDLSQNYELQDGDVIFVPEDTENRIFVVGAVQRPGLFAWRENMTIMDALSMAQGERADGKLSEITLIRKDPKSPNKITRYKVNIVRLKDKGDMSQNIDILPGDVINVPVANKWTSNEVYQYLSALWMMRNTLLNGDFFRP